MSQIIGPRWKKVVQDLKYNKTRTILTLLSIAAGAFAVGVLLIATLSCLIPAWNASRLTIREALAYE